MLQWMNFNTKTYPVSTKKDDNRGGHPSDGPQYLPVFGYSVFWHCNPSHILLTYRVNCHLWQMTILRPTDFALHVYTAGPQAYITVVSEKQLAVIKAHLLQGPHVWPSMPCWNNQDSWKGTKGATLDSVPLWICGYRLVRSLTSYCKEHDL